MFSLVVVVFNNDSKKKQQKKYFKSFLKACLRLVSVIIMLNQIHPSKLLSYREGFVYLYLITNLVVKQKKRRKAKRTYASSCWTEIAI